MPELCFFQTHTVDSRVHSVPRHCSYKSNEWDSKRRASERERKMVRCGRPDTLVRFFIVFAISLTLSSLVAHKKHIKHLALAILFMFNSFLKESFCEDIVCGGFALVRRQTPQVLQPHESSSIYCRQPSKILSRLHLYDGFLRHRFAAVEPFAIYLVWRMRFARSGDCRMYIKS